MRQIELLAPAGSFDALRAAINAGADAVYVGGQMFSARASANNFDQAELIRAIEFCHLRGKKLFLAVNTLLKKHEIKKLYEYIKPYYDKGLDAVIVQDMGVLQAIKTQFPNLPIHASTQMTIQSSQGARFIKELGAERVVLSRELNLHEISKVKKENDIEIECFVHGALCYSYSGQCLMSSMIGGRSGNRGRCAQSCRLPYNVQHNNTKFNQDTEPYVLSPRDICTLHIIPELVEAGIDSFKIEGRMKRAEYVAGVVSIYRKYLDQYLEHGSKGYVVEPEDFQKLQDLYNRGGFTTGYFKTKNGKEMMSTIRPNHWGTKIGKVTWKGKNAMILFQEPLNKQDTIEIWGDKDNIEFITKDQRLPGQTLSIISRKGVTLSEGAPVYRTKNESLLKELQDAYLRSDSKVIVKGRFQGLFNQPMSFQVEGTGVQVTVGHGLVQEAQSRPTTKEKVQEQLNKTGNTIFQFEALDIQVDDGVFISIQELNELRRIALNELEWKIIDHTKHRDVITEQESMEETSKASTFRQHNRLIVSVLTEAQLKIALQYDQIDQINVPLELLPHINATSYANQCKESKIDLFLTMPPVYRLEQQRLWEQSKKLLHSMEFTGFSVKLLDQLTSIQEDPNFAKKEIALEPTMYVINEEAKLLYEGLGINHFTASYELNSKELEDLNLSQFDMIVYGYVPVMVSAQCVNKTCHGCDKVEKTLFLEDRYHKQFQVRNVCDGCYNIIYNSQATNLYESIPEIRDLSPRGYRLDFTVEQAEAMAAALEAFISFIKNNKPTNYKLHDFTRGHYRRGIE